MACVVHGSGASAKIVAFLTTDDQQQINIPRMKTNLAKVLSSYMIPNSFKILDSLPRMVSMKIDRKALEKMDAVAIVCKNTAINDVKAYIESEEKVRQSLSQSMIGIALM